ncbi:hypothetical protein [Pseudogemmobacter sonorensis]|uniref:hypothetical protein n=1 Tax=Pseudogemmobacter sonorensis TaxID=2989681 RepID=UPI0036BDB9CA
MTGLEARLDALAATGGTLSYGALCRELGLRMADLTGALERMMEEDAAAGRPLRAALCKARLGGASGTDLPAPGFFEKAAALGFRIEDPAAFTADQRRALHEARR